MLVDRDVSPSRFGFGERLVSDGDRVLEGARSGAVVEGLKAGILPWLGRPCSPCARCQGKPASRSDPKRRLRPSGDGDAESEKSEECGLLELEAQGVVGDAGFAK